MQGTIDVRSVTKMTAFELEIKVFLNAFNLEGNCRPVMKMINYRINMG